MLGHKLWACEAHALQEFAAIYARHELGKLLVAQASGDYRRRQSIAVIEMFGVLMPNPPMWAVIDQLATRPQDIGAAAVSARMDPDVDQVLLLVDSPGGNIGGVDQAATNMAQLASEKRVITQVRGTMASAALYIGSQATEIRAGRTDLVGSIGTRLTIWDTSKLFEDAGIRVINVDTGEMKSAGEDGTEITDDQIAYFQTLVSGFNQFFQNAVQSGRNLTEEEYARVSDGRMWLAGMAQQLGLVDSIMTADETLEELTGQRASMNQRSRAAARMRLQQQSRALPANRR